MVTMEWAQWLEQVFTGRDYDLTIVAHTEPFDIGIYARKDYYFNYNDPVMRALMDAVDRTPDVDEQRELLVAAQERVAEKFVNAFLFQLPKTGVADARIEGLWENSPTQANDMTGVSWRE
jgi:peptide/nickel transport system substrate-binding protein